MRRQGNDEYKGQHYVADQWELPLLNLFSKSSCGGGGGGGQGNCCKAFRLWSQNSWEKIRG